MARERGFVVGLLFAFTLVVGSVVYAMGKDEPTGKDQAATILDVPFSESAGGSVLAIGLLYPKVETEFASSGPTYYTAWCIGGSVFMATRRYSTDERLDRTSVHPFVENMVALSNEAVPLPCKRFKAVSTSSFTEIRK